MSRITESARGMECQIRLPGVCNFNPETTVWAHPNNLGAGKGVGLKAADELGCYACSACHDVYDRRIGAPEGMWRSDVELAFHEGHQRSFLILKRKGLV